MKPDPRMLAAAAGLLLSTHPGPDFTVGAAALPGPGTGDAERLTAVLAGAGLLANTPTARWQASSLAGQHTRDLDDTSGEQTAATGWVIPVWVGRPGGVG